MPHVIILLRKNNLKAVLFNLENMNTPIRLLVKIYYGMQAVLSVDM